MSAQRWDMWIRGRRGEFVLLTFLLFFFPPPFFQPPGFSLSV